MFYVAFIQIINLSNIQYKFSSIIFNLLLCTEMYYVTFNHISYALIYIISISVQNPYSLLYISC